MNNLHLEAIYAVDANDGLAKNGVIPWQSKKDMKFFLSKTKGHVVVMGKHTYFSLPKRPLRERINIVLTRDPDDQHEGHIGEHENVIFTNDIDTAIKPFVERKIFIIGGKNVYEQFLPLCAVVWVTRLKQDYKCDTQLVVRYTDDGELIDEDDELVIRKYSKQIDQIQC